MSDYEQNTRQQVLKEIKVLVLVFLAAAAVTGLGGWLGVFLFPRFIQYGHSIGVDDITGMDGYAGLITVAMVLGGLLFALFQHIGTKIKEARDRAQISYDIYQSLHSRLTAPEAEAARRWILMHIPAREPEQSTQAWLTQVQEAINNKPTGWTDELSPGQQHVKRVLNNFDCLGFVAEHYLSVEEALLEWMSPPISKVWERIGPYVEDQSKRRHEPDFYKSARFIGELCIEWRKRQNLPKSVIVKDTV